MTGANAKIAITLARFWASCRELRQIGKRSEQMAKRKANGGNAAEEGVKGFEAAVKGFEQFNTLGKENMEAVVAFLTTYAKGIEAINAELMAFAKKSIEDSVSATKALMGAKTVKELVDMQSDFAKTSFDELMSKSSRLGEMYAKVAQQAFEPLNARVSETMEKFAKPMAA
jgi:phasin family protein